MVYCQLKLEVGLLRTVVIMLIQRLMMTQQLNIGRFACRVALAMVRLAAFGCRLRITISVLVLRISALGSAGKKVIRYKMIKETHINRAVHVSGNANNGAKCSVQLSNANNDFGNRNTNISSRLCWKESNKI